MPSEEQNDNFAKPMLSPGDIPTLPTVEFTEDDWNTFYIGYCVDSTHYSYLVHSNVYGRFWIPKAHVRLAV